MRRADDAGPVTQSPIERLAQANRHILDGVVRIHCRSPLASTDQIEQAVMGKQRQHVVEKTDARAHLRLSLGHPGPGSGGSPSRRSSGLSLRNACDLHLEMSIAIADLPIFAQRGPFAENGLRYQSTSLPGTNVPSTSLLHPEIIIFDVDGTLVDVSHSYRETAPPRPAST